MNRHRVDGHAAIIGQARVHEAHLPGLGVDLDLDRLGGKGIARRDVAAVLGIHAHRGGIVRGLDADALAAVAKDGVAANLGQRSGEIAGAEGSDHTLADFQLLLGVAVFLGGG